MDRRRIVNQAAGRRPAAVGASGSTPTVPQTRITRRQFLARAAGTFGTLMLGGALPALAQRAAAANRRLRVGASLALSGQWAADGRNVQFGYQYWSEQVNAAGGLLGQPVDLLIYDDGGLAERCAANYRQLLQIDGCDLLLGPYGSVPTQGALPVLEAAEQPCAVPISASPALWAQARGWCVQVTPNADTYMDGPLTRAAALGARTVGLVYLAPGFTSDIASGIRRKAQELGLELTADISYASEAVDFDVVLAPLAAADPDVAVGGGYVQSAVGLTRAAHRLGYTPRLFCWMEGPHRWPWPQWMGTEGDYAASAGLWLPSARTEGNAEFVRGFMARFGAEYPMDMLGALNHETASGYAAALLTQRAVEAAGSLDRGRRRDALFALQMETPYGRYAVDGRGAQVGKRVLGTQWVEGKQVIFWPPELAEADLIYPAAP